MTHFHVTAKLINTPFNQDRMLINRYMGGDYRGRGTRPQSFVWGDANVSVPQIIAPFI